MEEGRSAVAQTKNEKLTTQSKPWRTMAQLWLDEDTIAGSALIPNDVSVGGPRNTLKDRPL